jgi:rhodanese-related sulfurtransferase
LRNGTIGWTLAGQELDRGQTRKYSEVSEQTKFSAARRARDVADRTGVKRASLSDLEVWCKQSGRTTYLFDTRAPEEYAAGHIPGFRSTPGGQLVQETEMVAPVRGARILLVDSDGVRANMTASWLAQMAWDVCVLDDVPARAYNERGSWQGDMPAQPDVNKIDPVMLSASLAGLSSLNDENVIDTLVIDLAKDLEYVRGHIPGARYVMRSQFRKALNDLPLAKHYVLTCPDGAQSAFAFEEISVLLRARSNAQVSVLVGGTQAWKAAGFVLETGPTHLVSEPIDRYKRPYEGTNVSREAMQAYLDWEFGLVEQLGKDGTHHFWVLD